MPLFGSVLRAIRRSTDDALDADGRIRARFAVDPGGRSELELGEDEIGAFVDEIAAWVPRPVEAPADEAPADAFRRTVVVRSDAVVFELQPGREIRVPAEEWSDFVEGVREVRDQMAVARARLARGQLPGAAPAPVRAAARGDGVGQVRRTRSPSPTHELEPLGDAQRATLRNLLAARTASDALSRTELHQAAVAAGVWPDPKGFPGLSNAQKAQLWSFLEAEPRAGRVKAAGAKGPEATRWYLRQG